MDNTQRVTIRLDTNTIDSIKSLSSENDMSNFIRKAIKNELQGNHDSAKEFSKMMKNVEELDTKAVMEKLYHLEITTQIIFEEILKQSEALRMIYKRSTHSANYSGLALDALTKSSELKINEFEKTLEIIKNELDQINFSGVKADE